MSAPGQSAPGLFRLRVTVPGAPARWVAIASGGRAARLTRFPEHAFTASRESIEALSSKKAVQKFVPHNATFEAEPTS